MADPLALVCYLRLKFLVSIFRLLVTLTNVLKSLPKPKPDSVLKIPSRDNGRFIKAHLYKPVAEGSRIGNPRPVLINFCGSASQSLCMAWTTISVDTSPRSPVM
jgi:hypothetical protein